MQKEESTETRRPKADAGAHIRRPHFAERGGIASATDGVSPRRSPVARSGYRGSWRRPCSEPVALPRRTEGMTPLTIATGWSGPLPGRDYSHCASREQAPTRQLTFAGCEPRTPFPAVVRSILLRCLSAIAGSRFDHETA